MPHSQSTTKDQNKIIHASDRVVVVAARFALDEYLKYSAYICQANRAFQPFDHMAFYTKNKIDRRIPKIMGQPICAISGDEIETRTDLSDNVRARLRDLLTKMDPARSADWSKKKYKIIFLTSPNSPDTLVLPHDIKNNQTSKSEKRTAFTQGQRYVSLSRLEIGPNNTSELV